MDGPGVDSAIVGAHVEQRERSHVHKKPKARVSSRQQLTCKGILSIITIFSVTHCTKASPHKTT